MEKTTEILLHLLLCKGVGPTIINAIIAVVKRGSVGNNPCEIFNERKQHEKVLHEINITFEDLYRLDAQMWQQIFSISPKIADAIFAGLQNASLLQAELQLCKKLGVTLISILDNRYPSLLMTIAVPPPLLFVRGSLPDRDASMLAVVGARKADSYGRRCISQILPKIVSCGWTIVSGGAAGIDTFAHQTTLGNGGKTVVVIGCGLNHVYPESNRDLFEKIVAMGGALISIFPIDTPPNRPNFPIRNRVIAGLCAGTLVVQAAKESGSLITAKYALDENREVLAVPGPIDSFLSDGCHELLRAGAKLTATADDVFAAFEFSGDLSLPCALEVFSKENNKSAVISVPECKDSKAIILDLLASTTKTSDDLVRESGFSSEYLIDLLFELELSGLIVQHFSGAWERS